MNKPGQDNHFVLTADGNIFDLLDVLTYDETMDKTIDNIVKAHGKIVKAYPTPLKIFNEITALAKDGRGFAKIGATNWNNLFLIRGQFDGYWAFIGSGEDKKLVATSTDGLLWCFNIIDA